MVKTAENIKETGSHYTSNGLAGVLARRLLKEVPKQEQKNSFKVLDPACGDGELLLAMAKEGQDLELELIGVDADAEALALANKRLANINYKNLSLLEEDYLELVTIKEEKNLLNFDEETVIQESVDMVIANPPYVRTQVLGAEKAKILAKKYNLTGRIDLYHAFLIAMTDQLKVGGLISVITSNRYLTTKDGASLRKFLDENYEIIEVIDLGDTKLFGAAVLPAIFVGRKKDPKDLSKINIKSNFFKIYEENKEPKQDEKMNSFESMFELLEVSKSGIYSVGEKIYKVEVGELRVTEDSKEPWVMASFEDNRWADKVKANSKYLIQDVAKVRVGVKTTADSVFISSEWDNMPSSVKPEEELLWPALSSEHASKWTRKESNSEMKILYTHHVVDGKRKAIDIEKFPLAKAYLETHRERLEGRTYIKKANRNWYEIWVPQDPIALRKVKIVFPDISPEPRFYIDTNGCLVDGNCYWITPGKGFENDILFLITAISNTDFMSRYHDIAFQNKLYSGRRRYITQYINKYPVPDPTSKYSKQLIELGKRLTYENPASEEVKAMEKEIECLTYKAFGFDAI